jgi:hypothetical protein
VKAEFGMNGAQGSRNSHWIAQTALIGATSPPRWAAFGRRGTKERLSCSLQSSKRSESANSPVPFGGSDPIRAGKPNTSVFGQMNSGAQNAVRQNGWLEQSR